LTPTSSVLSEASPQRCGDASLVVWRMARDLQKLPWRDVYASAVSMFYFGDEYWELEIERFIKEVVADVIAEYGTEVWLYATEEDGLVGFGSLGASRWNWPLPTSKRVPISIIPHLGIHKAFWGQPREEGTRRFSDQIMDHLIYEAQQHTERNRALGLFVHPDNHRAIAAYQRAGFSMFSQRYKNEDDIEYLSMVLEW
jgi:RimJ/RimL family protein N-acetyltransferase